MEKMHRASYVEKGPGASMPGLGALLSQHLTSSPTWKFSEAHAFGIYMEASLQRHY